MRKVIIKDYSVDMYLDGRYVTSIFYDGKTEVLKMPNYSLISLGSYSRVYPDEIVDERQQVVK